MQITLTITNSLQDGDDTDLLSLEVYSGMTIEILKNMIQAETTHDPASQHIYHNGKLVTENNKTLGELEISDGDMLALHVRDMRGSTTNIPAESRGSSSQAGPSSQPTPAGEQDPETIRLQILGDPNLRRELTRQAPHLGDALDDPQRFAQVFAQSYDKERRERMERHRMIQRLNADPFDIEAQRKIEEIIRQERVMENLQSAMEHNPEVFGSVHMLYLDVEVNGHKVKALVDSGAQATIMSPSCAEACGIMRLVDRRFAGIAKGVGTANIVGRVHRAQIKIGPLFLACSFTVMEGKNVEMLLGLDMLKRHQASIDLAKDKLIIQGTEVPFLGEADIPKDSEQALQEEPRVAGPAGTTIGQRTGAVTGPGGSGPAASGVPAPAGFPTGPPIRSTPAAPRAPAPAPAPPPPQQRRTFPREHIEQLMTLGASEPQAIRALEATDGNVEYAASLIFDA